MTMDAFWTFAFAAKAASWSLAGTALLVFALACVSVLRGQTSAAQRHAVLGAALMALLTLPILGTTLPTWDSAPTITIEAATIEGDHSSVGTVGASESAERAPEPLGTAIDRVGAAVSAQAVAESRSTWSEEESAREPAATSESVVTAVGASKDLTPLLARLRSSASAISGALNPGIMALAIWGLGFVGVLGWMGLGVAARTVTFARGTTDVRDPRLILQLAGARDLMKVRRSVRLRWSEAARVPATWGTVRPVIVLPEAAGEWGHAQQKAALLHEMAHVSRFDHLLQTLSRLACAFHWFNPLVWRTAGRLAAEAEHASDDRAIAVSASPKAYARELVNVARTLRTSAYPRLSTTVAMARTSDLEHRVEAILDGKRSRRQPSRGLNLTVIAGTVLLTVFLSAWIPRFEEVAAQEPVAEVADMSGLTAERGTPTVVIRTPRAAPTGIGVAGGHTTDLVEHGLQEQALQEAPCLPGKGPRGSLTEVVNGRDDYTEVFWDTGRCNVTIRLEGVRFNADETDVATIADGGSFRLEQEGLGPDRRLDVTEERGELQYRYREDGREVAYDATVRSWLGDMIPTIFRVTGLQMDERIDRLLDRGGVGAVLDEVRLIHSDHTAGSYLAALMEIEELAEDDLMTAFQVAGENIGSDHELSQILRAAWRPGLSGPARESFLEAARGVSSDHELSEVLKAFLETGIGAPDVIPLLSLASNIQSDHALATTLTMVVETVEPLAGVTEAVLAAAEGIESDHELGQLLRTVHEEMPEALVASPLFLELAKRIGSDHELGGVLRMVVDDDLSEGQLLAVIDVAGSIGSDHELATLLREIIEGQAPLSDDVRQRLIDAAETIGSDYERDRTLAEIARGMSR